MTPLDPLVPEVPPSTRSDLAAVEEIDAALADAFAPEECGYCGALTDGRWCSSRCREADAYDGSHPEDR